MKYFVVAVCALVAAAVAVPVEENGLKYIEKCGTESGVTEEQWKAFDLTTDKYSHDIGCYFKCDMEMDGLMKDGEFRADFVKEIAEKAKEGDEGDKVIAAILDDCFGEVKAEDSCDKAGEFAECFMHSTAGVLAVTFIAGILEGLAEAVKESA